MTKRAVDIQQKANDLTQGARELQQAARQAGAGGEALAEKAQEALRAAARLQYASSRADTEADLPQP